MKAKKKPATKKRNPQDATLRNINALKKRVSTLEEVIARLPMVFELKRSRFSYAQIPRKTKNS